MQGQTVGKKRRSVSIWTHAQLQDVEARKLRPFQPEAAPQLRLVPRRSLFGLQLPLHAMILAGR